MLSKSSYASASNKSNFEIYDEEHTVEEAIKAMVASPRHKAAFHRLQVRNDKLPESEKVKHRREAKSVMSLLSPSQIVDYYDKTYKPAPGDNFLREDKFNQLCDFLNTEDEQKVSAVILREIRHHGPLVIAAFNRMQAEGRYNLCGKATIEEKKWSEGDTTYYHFLLR